jgi:hypothetical protein
MWIVLDMMLAVAGILGFITLFGLVLVIAITIIEKIRPIDG